VSVAVGRAFALNVSPSGRRRAQSPESTDIAVPATTDASARRAAVWVAIGVAYADRASPR
jgi:hypothetical protein